MLREREGGWFFLSAATLLVFYVFSPIDLVPDFIPLVGLLDDLLFVTLGISAFGTLIQDYYHRRLVQRPRVNAGTAVAVARVRPPDWPPVIDGNIPNMYLCPILNEPMFDPVVTLAGHTYERVAIETWFARGDPTHPVDPMSNTPLQSNLLIPSHTLRAAIQDFVRDHKRAQ